MVKMNANETIADIAKDFERESKIHRMCKSSCMSMYQVNKYSLRYQAAHSREVAELHDRIEKQKSINKELVDVNDELMRRIKAVEDALKSSPCGVIYQLGLTDDDGNSYDGVAVKFDPAEALKMPRVGYGDKFVVVPHDVIAAIREPVTNCNRLMEGGTK